MPCYRIPLVFRIEPQRLSVDIDIDRSSLADKGVFLVVPKQREKSNTVKWYKDELHTIKVFVRYPLKIPITFDKVSAITRGAKTVNCLKTVTLNPSSDLTAFELKVRPVETGSLLLCGVSMCFSNILCEHYVHPNGIGICAGECGKSPAAETCRVEVVADVPRIAVQVEAQQLAGECFVAAHGEQCCLHVAVKNISRSLMPIISMKLTICPEVKEKIKAESVVLDLVEEFGEPLDYEKTYCTKQVIYLTRSVKMYVFKFEFASTEGVTINETKEIPVVIEPSVVCFDWACKPLIQWDRGVQLAKAILKQRKEVEISFSHIKTVVSAKNNSKHPLNLQLGYSDSSSRVQVNPKDTAVLATSVPYNCSVQQALQLSWTDFNLRRTGKGLLEEFMLKEEEVPRIRLMPVIVAVELEGTESRSVKVRTGELYKVVLKVENVSEGSVEGLEVSFILSKYFLDKSELLNHKPVPIAISGELSNSIEKLEPGEAFEHTLSVLFTERDIYQIGGMCSTASSKAYVCSDALTFEVA